MNGFNENPSRLANRAQTSILVMARIVSTAVMATAIFVVGIFIGRATVPALFEKDRTEQLLARIAQEVQDRKQMLDQLRMKTPAPQVQYPDEFRKESAQGFVPEVKTSPSSPPVPVASQTAKPAAPAQPPTMENPAIATPSAGGNRPMNSVSAPVTETAALEKASVRTPQPPVAAPPGMTTKTEKPLEPMKQQQAAASTPGAVSKPQEPVATVAAGSTAKPGTGGSLKAMLYSRKTADDLAATIRKKGHTPIVQPRMTRSGVRYEVAVSGIGSVEEVTQLAKTIRQTHPEAEISTGGF